MQTRFAYKMSKIIKYLNYIALNVHLHLSKFSVYIRVLLYKTERFI